MICRVQSCAQLAHRNHGLLCTTEHMQQMSDRRPHVQQTPYFLTLWAGIPSDRDFRIRLSQSFLDLSKHGRCHLLSVAAHVDRCLLAHRNETVENAHDN